MTLEAFGHSHKNAIIKAMEDAGYRVQLVSTVSTTGVQM